MVAKSQSTSHHPQCTLCFFACNFDTCHLTQLPSLLGRGRTHYKYTTPTWLNWFGVCMYIFDWLIINNVYLPSCVLYNKLIVTIVLALHCTPSCQRLKRMVVPPGGQCIYAVVAGQLGASWETWSILWSPLGWILSLSSSSLGASTFSGSRGVSDLNTLMFPLVCCALCHRTMSYWPAPTGFWRPLSSD